MGNNVTVGDRIKRIREAKSWHQDELAQKIGLNQETISSIENSHRQVKARN